jgi:hypothetical protein
LAPSPNTSGGQNTKPNKEEKLQVSDNY